MNLTKQKWVVIGFVLSILIIVGLCVYFLIQSEREESGTEHVGYVNEFTKIEKISDNKYKAIISSAPMARPDGEEIDPSWRKEDSTYISDKNFYAVRVEGVEVEVIAAYDMGDNTKKGDKSFWSPQVFLDDQEIKAINEEPLLLETDPINDYYENNVLEWDYGICKRRLRIIEGMVQEFYIFEENPEGDIVIKSNTESDLEPSGYYAIDDEGSHIEGFEVVDDKKIVPKTGFDDVVYPVVIDDSYGPLSADGEINLQSSTSYSQAHDFVYPGSLTTYVSDTGPTALVGQKIRNYYDDSTTYVIYRGYVYFDTSGLPAGVDITSANLNLFVYYRYGNNDFDIVVQNGEQMHYPLSPYDYNQANYGLIIGGSVRTAYGSIDSYYSIPLNSYGKSWINKAGMTKFCLRSSRDVYSQSEPLPPPYPEDGYYNIEYVKIGMQEAGYFNRAPYLELEYEILDPPELILRNSSRDFGSAVENEESVDKIITVINGGEKELIGSVEGLTAPFSCISNCDFNINPGSSEGVTIRFSPTSHGDFTDQALFTSNGGDGQVSLSGTGLISGCIPGGAAVGDVDLKSETFEGQNYCTIRDGLPTADPNIIDVNTEGTNQGNIYIHDGFTVQMGQDTELVFNDGYSIINYGGKIAKASTNSVIKKGNVALDAAGTLAFDSSTYNSIVLDYSFTNGFHTSLFRENTFLKDLGKEEPVAAVSGSLRDLIAYTYYDEDGISYESDDAGLYTDTGLSPATTYTYYLRNGTTSSAELLATATGTTLEDWYIEVVANPSSGESPLNTELTATVYNDSGSFRYYFDFNGDGNYYDHVSSWTDATSYSASNTYSSAGNHEASVRVYNRAPSVRQGETTVEVCECTSGPCCDSCYYRPQTYICDTGYDYDYQCEGTQCGDDAEERSRTTTQYCDGESSSCEGSISYGSWSSWYDIESCSLDSEKCETDNSTYARCYDDSECGTDCDCTSGVCCDGCYYRSSSYVCDDEYDVDYECRYGTDCGDDVWRKTKRRYCSGSSSSCSGSVSGWIWDSSRWDNCNSSETCSNNDPICNYDECGCVNYCGDGDCRCGETPSTCSADCGTPPGPANDIEDCANWGIYAATASHTATPIAGGRIAETGDLLVRCDDSYVWCNGYNDREYAMACKVGSNCTIDPAICMVFGSTCCPTHALQTWSAGKVNCASGECMYCIVNKDGMSDPKRVNTIPTCSFTTGDIGDIFVKNEGCSWSDQDCTITGTDNCSYSSDVCSGSSLISHGVSSRLSRSTFCAVSVITGSYSGVESGNVCVRR